MKRDLSMDILRILAAISVVLLHTAATYMYGVAVVANRQHIQLTDPVFRTGVHHAQRCLFPAKGDSDQRSVSQIHKAAVSSSVHLELLLQHNDPALRTKHPAHPRLPLFAIERGASPLVYVHADRAIYAQPVLQENHRQPSVGIFSDPVDSRQRHFQRARPINVRTFGKSVPIDRSVLFVHPHRICRLFRLGILPIQTTRVIAEKPPHIIHMRYNRHRSFGNRNLTAIETGWRKCFLFLRLSEYTDRSDSIGNIRFRPLQQRPILRKNRTFYKHHLRSDLRRLFGAHIGITNCLSFCPNTRITYHPCDTRHLGRNKYMQLYHRISVQETAGHPISGAIEYVTNR